MIFVIRFSCFSRGPDDQGLPCGPGVIIVRERPVEGGSQRLKSGEKGEKGIAGARCGRHRWLSEQAMVRLGRLSEGAPRPVRPSVQLRARS
jgi:hypothetical protein